jgi:hypothetical protein
LLLYLPPRRCLLLPVLLLPVLPLPVLLPPVLLLLLRQLLQLLLKYKIHEIELRSNVTYWS